MNSKGATIETIAFATKFKKIFSVDRKNKIDSDDLKGMATSYQLKYSGLTNGELVLKFMDDFKKYLEFSLEEEKCWHNPNNPQYFLTSLAKVGTLSYPIFRGYIPPKKVKLLRPYVEKMIVKIFQLKDFKGFDLVFKHCHKVTSAGSITLAWGDFSIDEQKRRRTTREDRKREREISRSHTLTLNTTPLLSKDVAEKISVPIYDPNILSQEKMMKEIKRDVRKNISKLRADIKKSVIKEETKRERTVELKPMKVEKEVNQVLLRSPRLSAVKTTLIPAETDLDCVFVEEKSLSDDEEEGNLNVENKKDLGENTN